MMSSLKLLFVSSLLLASMPSVAIAAEDLTAQELVDRVLANKARYLTLTATVEKTRSEKTDSGTWEATSKTAMTWRWRAAGDTWSLQLVEQQADQDAAAVRRYARGKGYLKTFEAMGEGGGSGKVASIADDHDRHMGRLTPDGVLWDPLGYSWNAYVKGAQKLVHKEGIYYLTSSVIGGRAVVTIAVDPDHGYLPTMYDVEYPGKRHGAMRYSCHDLREVNGLWVPFRYELRLSLPDGTEQLLTYEVREIVPNQPLSDEELDFQFPPDAQVSYETKRLRLKMAMNRLPRRLSPYVVVAGLLFLAVAIAAGLSFLRHARKGGEDS